MRVDDVTVGGKHEDGVVAGPALLIASEVDAGVHDLPRDGGADLVLHQRPLRNVLGDGCFVERQRSGSLSQSCGRREHGREEGDGRGSLHMFLLCIVYAPWSRMIFIR